MAVIIRFIDFCRRPQNRSVAGTPSRSPVWLSPYEVVTAALPPKAPGRLGRGAESFADVCKVTPEPLSLDGARIVRRRHG
jgi:hypothetical protein